MNQTSTAIGGNEMPSAGLSQKEQIAELAAWKNFAVKQIGDLTTATRTLADSVTGLEKAQERSGVYLKVAAWVIGIFTTLLTGGLLIMFQIALENMRAGGAG